MTVTYKISPAGFGWLAQAFDDKNILSPFAIFEKYAPDFSEREKEELISQNVIFSDGTIQPSALAAFKVLSSADAFSRIRILGTMAPVDKVTYFQGEASCSVDSGAGYFAVTFPAMTKEAGFVMEEFTGSSRFVNVPFRTMLSQKAALVFLALVDLYRAAALLALAGEPKAINFSAGDITARANSGESLMWFVKSLKNFTNSASLSEGDLPDVLEELNEKKIVEEKGGKFYLMNEALDLANTFLIPEYVFNLSYGRLISPAEVLHSESYVIFCGMHNLLYIDTDGDRISIETMSGGELLSILMNLLQESPAKNASMQ